jgi:hypothetical protein
MTKQYDKQTAIGETSGYGVRNYSSSPTIREWVQPLVQMPVFIIPMELQGLCGYELSTALLISTGHSPVSIRIMGLISLSTPTVNKPSFPVRYIDRGLPVVMPCFLPAGRG